MSAKDRFSKTYGPWALVTGAASGIGAEIGMQLAARRLNLVLVDIQTEKLEAHAGRLSRSFGVAARAVTADLARPDFMDHLRPALEGLEIGLLVNNAAYGTVGRFFSTGLQEMLRTIDVNCRAPLILAHELGRPMMERRRGGIIFIASTAAFLGTPIVSCYSATKSFNLALGESLWDELREHGVDVLAFCPGPTDTPAFRSVNPSREALSRVPLMAPGAVAAQALAALGRGPSGIAGRMNRVVTFVMTRLLTRSKAVELTGKNTRALYPDDR